MQGDFNYPGYTGSDAEMWRSMNERNDDLPDRDLDDATTAECIACGIELGKPGGYAETGLCGPCCTGEAETLALKFYKW